LLAREIDADCLLNATDAEAVYAHWGEPGQQLLGMVSAQFLMQETFPAGSRDPKVQGAGQFVQATGRRALIGKLDQFEAMPRGTTGTQVGMVGADGRLQGPGSRARAFACAQALAEAGRRTSVRQPTDAAHPQGNDGGSQPRRTAWTKQIPPEVLVFSSR